ncbi:MAG: GntR family transcriptional regulator [Rhodobacteraceae bacterium]|nr:GntR family transcriptional regulator [Paracoccaceae bacterium]
MITHLSQQVDLKKVSLPDYHSESFAEGIYRVFREAILSLDFKPGEIIRKRPICQKFGVSRTPVADAMLRLESESLVEIIPQSITRVAKLSLRSIHDESFLREALEVAAVAYAAKHRTQEQVDNLISNLRSQKLFAESKDLNAFYQLDEKFHLIILECCQVSNLPATLEKLSTQVRRARLLLLPNPSRINNTVNEHEAIVKAIQMGNPDSATSAMRSHLQQLIKHLEPLEKQCPELFNV